MSYLKKPKKRLKYRFEGKKLEDLPADVDWMQLVTDYKVKTEWVQKYPYWFQTGSKTHLQRTRDLQEEARARRTHIRIKKQEIKRNWFKRIFNMIKTKVWQMFSAPR